MMKHKLKFKKAFTLVEILLAVFILEIGLLGVASFYSYSLSLSKIARNQTIASNLVQGLIDEQLAISYDSLPVAEGTKTAYSTDPASPFANFSKKVDIAYLNGNLDATYDANPAEAYRYMKKITVTVYYQELATEKNLQTATIKARY